MSLYALASVVGCCRADEQARLEYDAANDREWFCRLVEIAETTNRELPQETSQERWVRILNVDTAIVDYGWKEVDGRKQLLFSQVHLQTLQSLWVAWGDRGTDSAPRIVVCVGRGNVGQAVSSQVLVWTSLDSNDVHSNSVTPGTQYDVASDLVSRFGSNPDLALDTSWSTTPLQLPDDG